MTVKRIDLKEFRDKGYLQELNRRFLHPLGLSLGVIVDDWNEPIKLCDILDHRSNKKEIVFDDSPDKEKIEMIEKEWEQREKTRTKKLGYMVQPAEDIKK